MTFLRLTAPAAGLLAAVLLLAAAPAEAGIVSGISKIVTGVLGVPLSILAGTMSGPPIIGTLAGALTGTIRGVSMVLGGAVDLAGAALPIARAVAPFLVFL